LYKCLSLQLTINVEVFRLDPDLCTSLDNLLIRSTNFLCPKQLLNLKRDLNIGIERDPAGDCRRDFLGMWEVGREIDDTLEATTSNGVEEVDLRG
jgi:hypothetical protein